MSKPIAQAARTAIRPMAEANNRTWHCVAEAGHTLSDVMHPQYLGAKVKDMRPGDTFEIRHELHAFLVRGYILTADADAGLLSYAALEAVDLTAIPTIQYDFSDASVIAGRGGWAVVREADGALLRGEFATEAAATEWLAAKRRAAA